MEGILDTTTATFNSKIDKIIEIQQEQALLENKLKNLNFVKCEVEKEHVSLQNSEFTYFNTNILPKIVRNFMTK